MSGKSESTTSLLPKSSTTWSFTTMSKKYGTSTTSTSKKSTATGSGSPTNSGKNSPMSSSHANFAKKAKESGWSSTTPTGASLGG
ncbi:hypothetical protein K435DRAFT_963186 [Dendrothele bispora CBS 962.96]|uniref:Uncharacterized protein n=1 Tax=Dendrothele bispora (strain CBS 962.96) TaxID=1314807 RepID=A0A4S8MHW5_DENBC|nr:hypothetical protein K435DRAFT_963186 [Dendrothele bispora CBS 962.96]